MFLLKQLLIITLICFAIQTVAQNQGFHWVFSDSVGINFNTSPPSVDTNRIISAWEPAASISDNNGNLLFYVGSNELSSANPGYWLNQVRGSNDSIIMNGDSLLGFNSATQGIIILPMPNDTNRFYIFHRHINLYYSIVDMSLNGGLGEVPIRNVYLDDSTHEKMHAVRAANGTDWWLLYGRDITFGNTSICKFKIDSNGIVNKGCQQFNVTISTGYGQMIFSPQGDKIAYTGGSKSSKLFSFDRCTGNIYNETLLHSYVQNTEEYGCSFSPSGRYVYLSTYDSLWRYDTQAANIAATQQSIFALPVTGFNYAFGQHQLGPDGKIYITNPFHYASNIPTDSFNPHLSVINYPDSAFVNFSPFSFSLNGRKCYLNLPNMPNYNLGALENVNCDSILSIGEAQENEFYVYPNPGEGVFNIQFSMKKEKITIDVCTALGDYIYTQQVTSASNFFPLDLSEVSDGIYIVRLADEKQVYGTRKVVIAR